MKIQILALVISFFVCSQVFALPRKSNPNFKMMSDTTIDSKEFLALKKSSRAAVDVSWEFQTLEYVILRIQKDEHIKKTDMKFFHNLIKKYKVPNFAKACKNLNKPSTMKKLRKTLLHSLARSCKILTKLKLKKLKKALILAQARFILVKQEKIIRKHMSNLAVVMARCRIAMVHSADKDFRDCSNVAWKRLSASQSFVNDITALEKKLR